MTVNVIFKIAAVGILISVLNPDIEAFRQG